MGNYDNLIIWLIGSNASGKTTQAALIHKHFRKLFKDDYLPRFKMVMMDDEMKTFWTDTSSATANVGIFKHPIIYDGQKPTECSGTDTLSKKVQIQKAFEVACDERPIVIVEGVMATGTWIDFIKQPNNKVILLLMDISVKEDLIRIQKRRAKRKGVDWQEIKITDKTEKNITGKVSGFKRMFEKLKPRVDESYIIDGEQSIKKIQKQIRKIIKNNL